MFDKEVINPDALRMYMETKSAIYGNNYTAEQRSRYLVRGRGFDKHAIVEYVVREVIHRGHPIGAQLRSWLMYEWEPPLTSFNDLMERMGITRTDLGCLLSGVSYEIMNGFARHYPGSAWRTQYNGRGHMVTVKKVDNQWIVWDCNSPTHAPMVATLENTVGVYHWVQFNVAYLYDTVVHGPLPSDTAPPPPVVSFPLFGPKFYDI
jgi:hypothetical protein